MRTAIVLLFLLLTQACFGMKAEEANGNIYYVILRLEESISPDNLERLPKDLFIYVYYLNQEREILKDITSKCNDSASIKYANRVILIISDIEWYARSHSADERDLKRIQANLYDAKTNLHFHPPVEIR